MQHPLAGGDGGGQGARGQGQDWPPHSNWQRCRDCSDGKSPEIQEDTARHPSVRGEETLALIEIQITNIKRREQSGMKAWLWRMVNIRKLNFPFLLYKNIKPTLVQIKWGRELEVGKWRRDDETRSCLQCYIVNTDETSNKVLLLYHLPFFIITITLKSSADVSFNI